MTLIIGVVDKKNNEVVIGSDSFAIGSDYKIQVDKKLVRIKNFVIGYAASFLFPQIAFYNKSKFKEIHSKKDVYNFVMRLKKLMIKEGMADKAEVGDDLTHAVGFLLATEIGLFSVESNYQFQQIKDRWAVGCGMHYGLGFIDGRKIKNVSNSIKMAIKGASKVMTGVGGTVYICKVKLRK